MIALLKSTGLVESQVGRGVFVRKRTQLIRHAHDRYARRWREAGKAPFRTEVEAQGRTASVEVTSIDRVEPPKWIAERLALAGDAQVVRRANTYSVDGHAVQLVNTYIPLSIAQDTPLEVAVPGPGGIYAAFEDLGHTLSRMLEEVQARMPRFEEAQQLKVTGGHADPRRGSHQLRPARDSYGPQPLRASGRRKRPHVRAADRLTGGILRDP